MPKVAALVKSILAREWFETDVYYYSLNCDANVNRRYVSSNNKCSFIPHRRDMERIADGFADKEVGVLAFRKKDGEVAYIIGNYAAHPLASHCPGIGGHRISADYPGVFRKYIEEHQQDFIQFLNRPLTLQFLDAASEAVGVKLAQAVINGVITATRDKASYMLTTETLQCGFTYATAKMREFRKKLLPPFYKGKEELTYEIQCLSIGDICLVGMPGEALAELGLEIKWHSPFRTTFILYCSTAYLDYLCHGNALTQGGYEAHNQFFDSRAGLALVNAAVDGCHMLYERTYPDRSQWPENNYLPMVSFENRR